MDSLGKETLQQETEVVAETLESPGRLAEPSPQGATFPKVAVSGTHSENRAAGTGMPKARLQLLVLCALAFAALLKLVSRLRQGCGAWIPVSVASESGPLPGHWNPSLGALWGQGAGDPFTQPPRVRGSETGGA